MTIMKVITPDNMGEDFDFGTQTAGKINLVDASQESAGKVRFATDTEVIGGAAGVVPDAFQMQAAITASLSDVATLDDSGKVPVSQLPVGEPGGIAALDDSGLVPTSQLPAAVAGGINFKGTWDASTNTPTLASGTGTKGDFYKVSVAGTTQLDDVMEWNVGDMAIFDGTIWDKIGGSQSDVTSVAGRVGAVTLFASDITDASTVGQSLMTATDAASARSAIGAVGQTNAVFIGDISTYRTSDPNSGAIELGAGGIIFDGTNLVQYGGYGPGIVYTTGNVMPCISARAIYAGDWQIPTSGYSGVTEIFGGYAVATGFGYINISSGDYPLGLINVVRFRYMQYQLANSQWVNFATG